MMHEHDILSLKEHSSHPHHGSVSSHCAFQAFLNLRNEKNKCLSKVKSLMLVLVPDDLVGDPVEDIKDEECHRKGGPGDGVYPLRPVHKLLLHGVDVLGDGWLRVRSWSGVLDR